MKIFGVLLFIPFVIGAILDAESCAKHQSRRMDLGMWGGQHIGVEVKASGATIQYDCAHGTVDQSIELDSKGDFEVQGTHVKERGGPTREGEREDSHPARYTGHVDGKKMSLTVKLVDTGETIGTFTLAHDQRPIIRKCG